MSRRGASLTARVTAPSPATLVEMADRAYRRGARRDAAALCDAALARDRSHPEALHLRARLARDAGDLRSALRLLHDAAARLPESAAVHLDRADLLLAFGRLDEAGRAAATATSLAPDALAGWALLGTIRHADGDAAGAVEAYQNALRCDPTHAQTNNNLGAVLLRQGDLIGAHRCFRQALESNPRYAIAANNLGTVLEASGEVEAAESWFAAAASLDPAYVEPLLNLAASHEKRGRWADAAGALRRVLDRAPGHVRARWNLAIARLRLGAFGDGWALYDAGIGVADYRGPARPHPIRPFAAGARRVLLWGEQGVGEQLLGASMLPDLQRRGIGGVVETDPRLVPLFARSFPGFTFVPSSTPPDPRTLDAVDAALPLLDLGRSLRPDAASFPRHAGYLAADPASVARLRARYAPRGDERVVGLSWCSGARRNADAKSIDLAAWAPILRQPGLRFVSLQYGRDAAMVERARAATGVEILDDPEVDQLRDLDGFAAQVAAMDQVVTISNTTAHLAGALGRPAMVLLPADRGLLWFWMTERPDCLWYPSVTLLRQRVPGRWDEVIAAAAARLAECRIHP